MNPINSYLISVNLIRPLKKIANILLFALSPPCLAEDYRHLPVTAGNKLVICLLAETIETILCRAACMNEFSDLFLFQLTICITSTSFPRL